MSKTDVAFALALCLVVAGVGLLTIPGALVVAGGLLGAFTWAYERGSE